MRSVKLCQPCVPRPAFLLLGLALTFAACGADDDAGGGSGGAGSDSGAGAAGSAGATSGASGAAAAGTGSGGSVSTGKAGAGSAGTSGASGGTGTGGSTSGSGGSGGAGAPFSCDGLPGTCVEVCQGGQCDCQCSCRLDRECGGLSLCIPQGEPAPPCCGTGASCIDHDDCTAQNADWVCSGGPCARCVPRCPDDTYCGDGYVCGDEGACERARCDRDGFVCPALSACDAQHPEADSNGCLHTPCADDAECPQAVCVSGRCHQTAGRCVPSGCP